MSKIAYQDSGNDRRWWAWIQDGLVRFPLHIEAQFNEEEKKQMQDEQVYEVVVVEHPSSNDEDAGVKPEIVLGPKAIYADDEKTAAAKAGILLGRLEPTRREGSRMEVKVRPFNGR